MQDTVQDTLTGLMSKCSRYEIHCIFAKNKWNFKASNLQRDVMKSLFNVISDIHFNVISDKPNFSQLNGECLKIL